MGPASEGGKTLVYELGCASIDAPSGRDGHYMAAMLRIPRWLRVSYRVGKEEDRSTERRLEVGVTGLASVEHGATRGAVRKTAKVCIDETDARAAGVAGGFWRGCQTGTADWGQLGRSVLRCWTCAWATALDRMVSETRTLSTVARSSG